MQVYITLSLGYTILTRELIFGEKILIGPNLKQSKSIIGIDFQEGFLTDFTYTVVNSNKIYKLKYFSSH
jgi:hypothetical protein